MADCFTREWMRKKSEQLGLPFADFLRGLLLEELLYSLLTENKPLELVFGNDQILGTGAYKSKLEPSLLFWTTQDLDRIKPVLEERLLSRTPGDEDMKAEDIRRRIAEVRNSYRLQKEVGKEEEDQGSIIWTIGEEKGSLTERFLPVEGSLFEMTVPFTLIFKRAEGDNLYREAKSLCGIARKAPLNYFACAPEQLLGGWLYRIWSYLELIPSLEEYDLTCQMLEKQAVDGRRVSEEIKKIAENSGLSFEGDRVATIETYKTYRYMEKRWISYCKNHCPDEKKTKSLAWKDMVELICGFSKPIWDSLKNDGVFVGDWMPELGRFM